MLLKNVEVRWVYVNSLANTESKKFKNAWMVNCYPSKDQIKMLEKQGLTLKEDDNGVFTRFKRNEQQVSTGNANKKPVCVLANNTPYEGMVGNGSLCNVQYRLYEWDGSIYSDFMGLQILQLVEYGVKEGEEFVDESEGSTDSEFKNEEAISEAPEESSDDGVGEDIPF